MEKDDKIRQGQQKTKQFLFVGMLVVAGIVGLYAFNNDTETLRRDIENVEQLVHKDVHGDGTTTSQNKPRWMPAESLPELEQIVKSLDEEVRAIKKTGIIMETDPTSIQKTKQLQTATRNLLKAKYGDHPNYRVRVDLEFQPSIPDFAEKGPHGSIVIEMAPIDLQPVSVYNFLEIARTWIRGSFHRNAGHVLQVNAVSEAIHRALPFQEYSKEFPHKKGTTGYAGRPSGPGWYVSIQDNTMNHGPGSQQSHNPYEADANFGTVVEGMDDVVPRIHTVKQSGWLDEKNKIFIRKKTILVPDRNGDWEEWVDWTKANGSHK